MSQGPAPIADQFQPNRAPGAPQKKLAKQRDPNYECSGINLYVHYVSNYGQKSNIRVVA